jgi:photosystem II stability/assembly factor-like uncharacterized protein
MKNMNSSAKPTPFGLHRYAGGTRAALVSVTAALGIGLGLGVSGSAMAELNPKVMPASGPLTKQAISRLLLSDVARAGNRIVAVGDRGYVVFSDSNGESWERAKTPAGVALLTSVHFAEGNTVWATGHDSTILKSTDQGKEWTQAYSSTKDKRPLLDVLFVDANIGFAVGAYGAFYETNDAGKSWSARKVIPSAPKAAAKPVAKSVRGKQLEVEDEVEKTDEDRHLNAIVKLADGRLFIVGEAGTMLVSSDAGKTWSRVASPYKGSFFGVIQANDGAVVAFGLRGNVYRSADGLKSWSQVNVNTKASMMGATKLADGTIALAGLSGALLVSRDAGASFTPLSSGTIKALSGAVTGGPNSLLVIGETGARDVLLTASADAAKK